MISEATEVEAVLARLRGVGVQLSVDDFGTGYSSLALLQRVAVNELKIDRSFVFAMTTSESDAAIVRATIDLAHGLGVRVVAEGVETIDHVNALKALGCDAAQGWHYGKPAPGPHLRTAWLGFPSPDVGRNVLPAGRAPAAG
jgi:diguanylate cyclase